MSLTLPKRQPAGTDSGHCPSGKWQYAHVHTNREGGTHTHWHMYGKSDTRVQTYKCALETMLGHVHSCTALVKTLFDIMYS